MSRTAIIEQLEQEQLKQDVPDFNIGDTIKVHIRIIEGSKERTQIFTGTVIARKGGGVSETFSLHRVAYGEGMERVFLLHSPRIAKIEVVREGKVRRAKLYYLRGTSGKAAKVKARVVARKKKEKTPVTLPVEEAEPVAEPVAEVEEVEPVAVEAAPTVKEAAPEKESKE